MTNFSFSKRTQPNPNTASNPQLRSTPQGSANSFPCTACKCRTAVTDSRPSPPGIRRRRRCLSCELKFTTFEYAEGDAERVEETTYQGRKRILVTRLLKLTSEIENVLDELQNSKEPSNG